jgi:hypothetical protein
MNVPARKLEAEEMPYCGTIAVMFYDGRAIDLDRASGERLERLLDNAPDDLVPEVNRFCLCITDAKNGYFYMPSKRWVDMFNQSLGRMFRANDISIGVGPERLSLYDYKYMMNGRAPGRKRVNA